MSKEKYLMYLSIKASILKVKEHDNTMTSIGVIVQYLDMARSGRVPEKDMDFIYSSIQPEMSLIGRRHDVEVITYEDFVTTERENKLEDLGL